MNTALPDAASDVASANAAAASNAHGTMATPQVPQPPPVAPFVPDVDSDLVRDIRAGTVVVARLSLRSWTGSAAFGQCPSVLPADVFLAGSDARGGALSGDVVAIRLNPQSEWHPAPNAGPDSGAIGHTPAGYKRGSGEDAPRLADGRVVVHAVKHKARPTAQTPAERIWHACCGDVLPTFDWNRKLQAQGSVCRVLERRFERFQCCRLFEKAAHDPGFRMEPNRWYRFKSYADDFPVVAVYGRDVPQRFREHADQYLFLIEVRADPEPHWVDRGRFPVGRVLFSLGQTGTIESESAAIAYTHKIKDAEFTDDVNACVMQDFVIPGPAELAAMGRRDLRTEEFVCTIDPATARDLDDALSVCQTAHGYRVGVHIADVSHFVPVETALDEEAQQRATSTYFVERVIPMLPRKLCEDYCSLNAGVDKFAFSGIWEFDRKGNVTSEWFGQSVIRNRCRMAYEDAQRIIDGDESGDTLTFINEDEPRDVLVKRVVNSVKMLSIVAKQLKAKRVEKGALALNKGRMRFIFESADSRLAPKAITQERSKAANYLVEEFMLHANCRVAEKVVEFMPDATLLRKHDPPVRQKVARFTSSVARFGYKLNGGSSKALRESLEQYADSPDIDSLRCMATLCMSLAKYICSDDDANASVAHYALAAPLYSHFTSPIRRYADLITHRQLLLALDIEREVKRRMEATGKYPDDVDPSTLPHARYYYHPDEVAAMALHCVERKEAAKKAGEASLVLFLCTFIQAAAVKAPTSPNIPQHITLKAVVVRLKDVAVTLFIPEIALMHEIPLSSSGQLWQQPCTVEDDGSAVILNWGAHPSTKDLVTEKLTLFSPLLVTLKAVVRGHMQLEPVIHPPWERDEARVTGIDFQLE